MPRAPMLCAFVLCLLGTAADAQTPPPGADSAACVRCHAQPSRRFHADPTHKKFECGTCHVEAKSHLADSKVKPELAQDDALCSGCHPLKPRR